MSPKFIAFVRICLKFYFLGSTTLQSRIPTQNIHSNYSSESQLFFGYICSIRILRNLEVNPELVQPYPSTTLPTQMKLVRKSCLVLSVQICPFQNYPKSFDRTSSVPMAMRFWSRKTVLWRFIPSIGCGIMVN